jgi:EAL domain-containing protein (putative c-di-GMP-specific phosphodiesterase class I)
VDYLKIDGSFIRHLPDSLDDQIIVQALSQMSAGFGRKTIAEYVETEATLELLRHYGIDYAQGYLISRPLSAEEAFGENSFNQRFGHEKAAVPGVGAGGQ